jgi:hypothetical protein
MRARCLFVLTTATAILSGPAVVGAAGSADADQQQADAAVAAFVDTVEAAGYESIGPGDEGDVLDLRPSDDDEADDPTYECIGSDLSELIADDETFVGETARATSDDFAPAGGDPATDDSGFALENETINAVVAFVDEEEANSIGAIVDTFGSTEVADCVRQVFAAELEAGNDDDAEYDVEITSTDDLEVGDASARMAVGLSATYQGTTIEVNSTLSVALVGRALVMVFTDNSGGEVGVDPVDALAAMVDALQE